ncbi:hypothetical protein Bpfe_007161, partial [Biomphalaria pfeifferi]
TEWSLKWLVCLIPGAISMATSIMAILGVLSEPCLLWKGKIVLALLLHPLHFIFSFVVLIFSMISLNDILDKGICFRLIAIAVASQWGVIFSTLALCLGRAMQVGSSHLVLPSTVECIMVPAAVVLVLILHVMTILLSDLSLSIKMIHHIKSETLCPMFLNSTDMFPRRIMGYIIMIVNLVVIAAIVAIVTNIRKHHSSVSLRAALQAGDIALLQQYIRPFEDPQANNNALAHGSNESDNSILQEEVHMNEGEEPNDTPSQTTEIEGTSSGRSCSQDYYDIERRRHRAQSPPPGQGRGLDQPAELCRFHQLHRGGGQIQGSYAAPQPNILNEQPVQPQGQDLADVPLLLLPDIILRVMFPHRRTTNKPRFAFTQAHRTRNLTWPTSLDSDVTLQAGKPYPVDITLCVSGGLFVLTYFPFGVYLIFTSDEPGYPFLDTSFQPVVVSLLLKNAFESLVYFIGRQCFPWFDNVFRDFPSQPV